MSVPVGVFLKNILKEHCQEKLFGSQITCEICNFVINMKKC